MRGFRVVFFVGVFLATSASAVPSPGESGSSTGAGALATASDVPSWNHWMGIGDAIMAVLPGAAVQAYERQDFGAAAAFYGVLHRVNPDDIIASKRLGFALKETGRYEEAHDLLFQASVTEPNDYLVWWWLSDTQRLLGDYKNAYDSMVTSRDVAPETEKSALQNYVDYTEMLGAKVPSWGVFEKHREFAKRHEKVRRLRRTIAEYMSALEAVPPAGADDTDTSARVGWVNNQIGIQYNQLKEPEVALDYFFRAIKAYAGVNSKPDVMMAKQNLGVTYRVLADSTPVRRAEYLALGAKYWGESLQLATELNDLPYMRYARAGQLICLAQGRGLDDPETKVAREANLLELPWRGPLAEYTTATVALAELSCRMREGDFAGARIVGEMALQFYDQSSFLLDSEEAVRIRVQLAMAYTKQQHYDEAMNQAAAAQTKLDTVRNFMDSDAFSRSTNRQVVRGIAVARLRAAVLKGDFTEAQRVADGYALQARTDLLGSKIFDEAARNDYVSEKEVISRRLAALEKDLEDAKGAGDGDEVTRLTARIASDKLRGTWLEKGVFFNASDAVNYRAVPVLGPMELAPTWPADTALVTLLTDAYGSVALVNDGKAAWGTIIPEANQGDLRKLCDTVTANALTKADAALPALDELGKMLLEPLREHLGVKTLYFSVDGALADVPMELLRRDGKFLIADHDIACITSASYLIHAQELPHSNAATARVVCAGDTCAALAEAVPGAANCEQETCLTQPTEPARLTVIGGAMDFSAPDAMLSAITLKAADGKDDLLYAAELLGAEAKTDAVWFASAAPAPWNPDAWSAFEETFLQAGARNVVHPLAPLATSPLLKAAANGRVTVKAVSEAKRSALAANPGDLTPAFVVISGAPE